MFPYMKKASQLTGFVLVHEFENTVVLHHNFQQFLLHHTKILVTAFFFQTYKTIVSLKKYALPLTHRYENASVETSKCGSPK